MKRKLISVVVPMYFEELVAYECYNRLSKVLNKIDYDYEIIFVNDGSTDRTQEILEDISIKDSNIKVISFSRNFGHQIAVTCGIENSNGDAVIIIDADLQDPPELIPKMIEKWEDGLDVVYAKRSKRKGESFFKLFTAKAFYRILNKLTDVNIPLDTGDFRLIDRKVAIILTSMKEKNRFLRGMVAWIGFNQGAVEYERDERFAGNSKYPIKKMLKFAFDGIFSFSTKPLKYVERLGIISILIAFYLFFDSIFRKLLHVGYQVNGWTSLIAVITFFGGVQLISIGVLGEYIGRLYEESKGRPLYIIKKVIENGKEVGE